ncbi:MAG: OmpA family protein [Bacteroidota bacterium]
MKKGHFFLILIFFTFHFPNLTAQKISKKARKLYQEAREAAANRNFNKAISNMQKAVNTAPEFAEAHRDLAIYYFSLRDISNARTHYQAAADLQPNDRAFAPVYIRLAEFNISEGKYESALKYAKTFLGTNPSARFVNDIKLANHIILSAEYALEAIKYPVEFKSVPLPASVNKLQQQYFPTLTADRQMMIFTGRSGDNEDIYEVYYKDGKWQEPQIVEELSTKKNEGTCSISADGKTLIFTACMGNSDRKVYGKCDLFISYKTGDKWSKPENMGRNINTKGWESQPALSADGRAIYFISDRGGGVGQNDIWMSKKDKEGNWLPAVNLGKPINTPLNEVSPFIHTNGKTLFFSSRGHKGFWGYDLFKAEKDKEGNWQTPENLGYPINDFHDQVSLFITADGKKGYYSNEKQKAPRQLVSTLYTFDIPEEIRIKETSDVVKGKVFDIQTKDALKATIELTDIGSNEVISVINSDEENGEYMMVLTEGAEYALHINREGYLYKSLTFNYKEQKEAQEIYLDIPLEPITTGSKVTLNNIFFESGSYSLLPKSKTELDKLVAFMQENGTMKIEIAGHTDDVGSDDANKKLSQNRANSVVEYLTKEGIEETRLSALGYGETQPVAANDTDENRAINRRIEFKIL